MLARNPLRRCRTSRKSRLPLAARTTAATVTVLLALLFFNDGSGCSTISPLGHELFEQPIHHQQTRRLLEDSSSDNSQWKLKNEPPYCAVLSGPDRDPKTWVRACMVLLYTAGVLYTFQGLAIICDDYFTASLERICEKLNLSPDVGGATFMAAGSSAPELFTSLADSFGTKNNIGVGTILGSAVFNLVVILAASSYAAGTNLYLDWRPLFRDSIFYTVSILMVMAVMLTPVTGTHRAGVEGYEAAIMVATYGCYIVYMIFNETIISNCEEPQHNRSEADDGEYANGNGGLLELSEVDLVEAEAAAAESSFRIPSPSTSDAFSNDSQRVRDTLANRKAARETYLLQQGPEGSPAYLRAVRRLRWRSIFQVVSSSLYWQKITPKRPATSTATAISEGRMYVDSADQSQVRGSADIEMETGDDDDDEEWQPQSCGDWVYWVGEQPLKCVFKTVPDVSDPESSALMTVCAFVMSIVWISLLSAFMVRWATKIGCLCSVNASLMGLVVLAAGTSVPDCLASVSVAKDGEGDMAVSNAIGSNVFDILLGLGLPWLLATHVFAPPGGSPMFLLDEGKVTLIVAGFQLLVILAIVFFALMCNRWVLTPAIGSWLFLLYFLFVVLNLCIDMKIIHVDKTLFGGWI